VQRGRIEYEGETSVYTQISPLKIRGKDEYILIFPGEKLVYTHFSGGKMSRGKNEYVTPVQVCISMCDILPYSNYHILLSWGDNEYK
jgi:hypothetical protein